MDSKKNNSFFKTNENIELIPKELDKKTYEYFISLLNSILISKKNELENNLVFFSKNYKKKIKKKIYENSQKFEKYDFLEKFDLLKNFILIKNSFLVDMNLKAKFIQIDINFFFKHKKEIFKFFYEILNYENFVSINKIFFKKISYIFFYLEIFKKSYISLIKENLQVNRYNKFGRGILIKLKNKVFSFSDEIINNTSPNFLLDSYQLIFGDLLVVQDFCNVILDLIKNNFMD